MLPAKIKLTDQIINNIKAARSVKRLTAAALSKAINRDESYISSLELGRLRKISSADLIQVFCVLFDIQENEAIEKIDNIISTSTHSDLVSASIPYATHNGSDGIDVTQGATGTVTEKVIAYEKGAGDATPELIGDMLESINSLFIEMYEMNPKEAVFAMKSFTKTLQNDPDLAASIMEIPFYTLKSLSISDRNKIQSDILSLIKNVQKT